MYVFLFIVAAIENKNASLSSQDQGGDEILNLNRFKAGYFVSAAAQRFQYRQ